MHGIYHDAQGPCAPGEVHRRRSVARKGELSPAAALKEGLARHADTERAAGRNDSALAALVKKATAEGKEKIIIFNLSGHGLLDLSAYETYLTGKIQDV